MALDSPNLTNSAGVPLFKFPGDLRNDIIYCQRSLKSHIKVHQMVIDVYQDQPNSNFSQKNRITEEIETAIYEINAEQQYLFLRLRRFLDCYRFLDVDRTIMNSLIATEIVPFVNDESEEIRPITVQPRNSEEHLIRKYFDTPKPKEEDKVVYEIIDTDDEGNEEVAEIPSWKLPSIDPLDSSASTSTGSPKEKIRGGNAEHGNSSEKSQVSVLKPTAQRLKTTTSDSADIIDDVQQEPEIKTESLKKMAESQSEATDSANVEELAPVEVSEELPVSKKVKLSRFNLRQALKKARTQAAASVVSRSNNAQGSKASTSNASSANSNPSQGQETTKKIEAKAKSARNTAGPAAQNAPQSTSGSDDSSAGRESPPTQSFPFHEQVESHTLPEHCGKEMFLRLFDLYTPDALLIMQQRRSKRRRRNVHSNERADFHYGYIEYGNGPVAEKKRKAFLVSPQAKRNLQNKRVKRAKSEDAALSRSSSSSPDEKRCCTECLKSGGYLDQCNDCKEYYHQSCHQERDEDLDKQCDKANNKQVKQCPQCKRTQDKLKNSNKIQKNKTLHSTAQELAAKISKEKDRRSNLQQASNMYKIQMRNLYNIVNEFKHAQEPGKSEKELK